jgi:hypothetical protein
MEFGSSQRLYANSPMAEILGTTVSDLVGKPFFDYVFPEDLGAAQELFDRKESATLEMVALGCGQHCIHPEHHHSFAHLHRKRTYLRSSLNTGFDYEAGLQANTPLVQPAGDGGADHHFIGQRIARMRAAILKRQVAVADIEYRDRQVSNTEFTALARRNGPGGRHLNPLHSAPSLLPDRLLSLDCSARGHQRYRDAESGEALAQRVFLQRELVLADSAVCRILPL